MFQQLASPRRVPAFFDCFDELRIIFEHTVDRFHNELRGVTAGAGRNISETRLLLHRKLDFRGFRYSLTPPDSLSSIRALIH